MGTRLLSEAMIRKQYPHIRYVRIHTAGRNFAVIYAWSEDLELSERDMSRLKRFAAGYLPSYVCYQVKEYPMLQADEVPSVPEPPEDIVRAAMDRSLDQHRIAAMINGMISGGEMTFDRYDIDSGTIQFIFRTNSAVTDIEKELIGQYLSEVIPIGCYFKLTYC